MIQLQACLLLLLFNVPVLTHWSDLLVAPPEASLYFLLHHHPPPNLRLSIFSFRVAAAASGWIFFFVSLRRLQDGSHTRTAMNPVNATALYVSASRAVLQSDPRQPHTFAEMYTLLPFFRQALACHVCGKHPAKYHFIFSLFSKLF